MQLTVPRKKSTDHRVRLSMDITQTHRRYLEELAEHYSSTLTDLIQTVLEEVYHSTLAKGCPLKENSKDKQK
ncbi:hypothetical protein ES702_05220 [subsurface metagenome]